MEFFKKFDVVSVSYLLDNKLYLFSGYVKKIKKHTFHLLKFYQNILIKKIFFIKNPNIISIKKIK